MQPGARIEEFEPICEVQSDKASVEITSRYNGVIKSLHYDVGQMALVGKPLVDIDVEEDGSVGEEPSPAPAAAAAASPAESPAAPQTTEKQPGKYATLATPAVRRLTKELDIELSQITGTGKDGRVLKEDVLAFQANGGAAVAATQVPASAPVPAPVSLEDTVKPLTPVQTQMFKAMTNSLAIPHFLYTEEVGIDGLTGMRGKVNKLLKKGAFGKDIPEKVSYMPFFIKALSIALKEYPIVNSRVTFDAATGKPQLVHRPYHNIGVAMDTPSGLIVPNIKNVQDLTVLEIAQELTRLQELGTTGKFSSADLQGSTISISNIGNVGGTYLMPVIVDSQVAIVAIGKARVIPSFDEDMEVVPKQVINTSWSGDHRVLDGMTLARMADRFKQLLEDPELMIVNAK